MSLRIGLVHSNNEDLGGSDTALVRFAQGCLEAGWQPTLYLGLETEIVSAYRQLGIPVQIIAQPRIKRTKNPLFFLDWAKRVRRSAQQLREAIVRDRIELVFGNDFNELPAAIAAKIADRPCLSTVRLLVNGPGVMRRTYLSALASRSDLVLCKSEAIRQYNFGDLPRYAEKAITLYDWFEPDPKIENAPRDRTIFTQFDVPPDARIILMVGRIDHWKGQHVLIDALPSILREVPNAHVVLLGDTVRQRGREQHGETLRNQAHNLGVLDHIHFGGHVDPIEPYILAAQVLVHCSVEPEPYGLTVLEGMRLGTPVVASGEGGPLETAGDPPAALLHRPGDSGGLARQILAALIEPNTSEIMVERGRLRAEEFSYRSLWPRYQNIVEDVLGRFHSRDQLEPVTHADSEEGPASTPC